MCADNYLRLASPLSRRGLTYADDVLVTTDHREIFPVINGVACLLAGGTLDDERLHEQALFDSIAVAGIPYFRESMFKKVWDGLEQLLDFKVKAGGVAEMGGGEGHWSRYVKGVRPELDCYVCDLSMKSLVRAPEKLIKVQGDVTKPLFQKESLGLISFWVSLHHLDVDDQRTAISEAARALDLDGILLVLEPNRHFFPRQLLYKTRLGKDVYFDDNEQAIDFCRLSHVAGQSGLQEIGTFFFNPPYNPDFVKMLGRWYVYLPVVEMLHRIGPRLPENFACRQRDMMKYGSLYGVSIFRKTSGEKS